MKKFINYVAIITLAILAIYSPKGFSQQISPPLVFCNGGWIPQGTPCGGYGGQNFGQAVQLGGNLLGNVSKCDLAATAGGAVIGAAAGNAIQGNKTLLGAAIGGIAGFLGSDIVCKDNVQSQQVAFQQRRCAQGFVWAKLDWKGVNGQPDHPQHGQFVCMKPDDPHRASGT